MATVTPTAARLVRDADVAMYRARSLGRARCELFDAELHERVLRRMGTEKRLRAALAGHALELVRQRSGSRHGSEPHGFTRAVARSGGPGAERIAGYGGSTRGSPAVQVRPAPVYFSVG